MAATAVVLTFVIGAAFMSRNTYSVSEYNAILATEAATVVQTNKDIQLLDVRDVSELLSTNVDRQDSVAVVGVPTIDSVSREPDSALQEQPAAVVLDSEEAAEAVRDISFQETEVEEPFEALAELPEVFTQAYIESSLVDEENDEGGLVLQLSIDDIEELTRDKYVRITGQLPVPGNGLCEYLVMEGDQVILDKTSQVRSAEQCRVYLPVESLSDQSTYEYVIKFVGDDDLAVESAQRTFEYREQQPQL